MAKSETVNLNPVQMDIVIVGVKVCLVLVLPFLEGKNNNKGDGSGAGGGLKSILPSLEDWQRERSNFRKQQQQLELSFLIQEGSTQEHLLWNQ